MHCGRVVVGLLVCTVGIVGCSSDEDAAEGAGGGAGSAGAAGGMAGGGATAGQAGSGATGGTAGMAGSGGVAGSAGTAGSAGVGGGAGSSGSAGAAGTAGWGGAPATKIEALEALGVNVDPGQRESAVDGAPIPDEAHPLGAKITTLSTLSELFISGVPTAAGPHYQLLDEPVSGSDLLSPSGSDAWAQLEARTAVAADIDGDGFDEVVNVLVPDTSSASLVFRVIEDASQQFAETSHTVLTGLGDLSSHDLPPVAWLQAASGDMDGDGAEEVLVSFAPSNTVYRFVPDAGSFQQQGTVAGPASDADYYGWTSIGLGDMDGDGKDELGVVTSMAHRDPVWSNVSLFRTGHWAVYDEDAGALTQTATGNLINAETNLVGAAAAVVGDLDGDNLDELAAVGVALQSQNSLSAIVVEDGKGIAGPGTLASPYTVLEVPRVELSLMSMFAPIFYAMPSRGAAGDFDGDQREELFVAGFRVDLEAGALSGTLVDGSLLFLPGYPVVAGDFDGGDSDGREDVAAVGAASGMDAIVRIYGAPPMTGTDMVLRREIDVPDDMMPALAAPNVDADSRVVRYDGDHAVVFSDPVVISVLASAPMYSNVAHADGSTTLGDSTTIGHEVSHAVGASVGVSVGAKASSPLWGSAGEFSGKLTVRTSADFIWGSDSSITYTSAIENPAGQDLVVFTAIPFDAYAYTVIVSPDPTEVGERFTLNIPRDASVRHAEVGYYNAHNFDAPDVDSSILTHTVGNPATYSTTAERDARVSASPFALQSNKTQTCSGGGAVTELGVEWTKTGGAGFSAEVALEAEFESVTGGLLLGASAEYRFGVSVIWYYGEGIYIIGRVGDVMPQDYDDSMAFDWGVYCYQRTFATQDLPFTVVDYWVQ